MPITNAKVTGRAMLLAIGDIATVAGAVFTTIGGVRAKAYASSTAEIDISDGDDGVWKKGLEGGEKSITFTISGLGNNNVSYELMKAKEQAGNIWPFQLSGIDDGDSIKGLFLITGLQENGPYNGAQDFSATLVSQDTPTFTNV